MRSLLAGTAIALIGLAIGCNEQRVPGGPGVTNTPAQPGSTSGTTTANRTTYNDSEETFALNVPTLSTKVKQGEATTAKISISRGKNFDEDVALTFTNVPKGVTMNPANMTIARNEKEGTIEIHAADDAALGDFTVKVTGHPTTGADGTNELKLTVTTK